MKVKLLVLLGMATVPLLSIGQTKPVFYNKGKMSIVSADTTKTALYVNGDFIVSGDATNQSDIHVKDSKTVVTGDFIHKVPVISGIEVNIFTTYESNPAKFVFRPADNANPVAQNIKLDNTMAYRPVLKGSNYIKFPDIEVVNKAHVTVAPEIAMSTPKLLLTKGKLILDSRRFGTRTGDIVEGTSVHNSTNSTLIAHLEVEAGDNIVYGRQPTGITDINDFGVVQVRVALDPKLEGTTTVDQEISRGLVGMGSPFEEIRADYFMWNFLMFPYDSNIIGSLNYAESNPQVPIKAGKGFVVGIDLRGNDINNYNGTNNGSISSQYASTSFDDRNTDMITFDRLAFANDNNIFPLSGFSGHGNSSFTAKSITDAEYANEKLVHKDTEVSLERGFNYLANPFTTPLSLKNLIDEDLSATANPWKVKAASTPGSRDIMSRAWVLNPSSRASGLYNVDTQAQLGKNRIHATYSYLLMKDEGGTFTDQYDDASNDGYTIAPLQMFLVYSPNGTGNTVANKITIPASERSITAGSQFLRSSNATKTVSDDYLFEVEDLTSNAFDRVAVVLRTPDEIMTNPTYSNVKKLVSSVLSDSNTKSALEVLTEEGVVRQAATSLIYTKDTDGSDLESLFLSAPEGASEVSTTLYLAAGVKSEKVAISAKRLSTMDRATEIWLDDKIKNTSFLLSEGKAYETGVTSTDNADRFTLRFKFASSNIGNEIDDNDNANKSISSYYVNGTLTVTGFDDADLGSMISVYDIQGRLITQRKVDQLRVDIQEAFAPGAYIVKVLGNKSYVSKFLVR